MWCIPPVVSSSRLVHLFSARVTVLPFPQNRNTPLEVLVLHLLICSANNQGVACAVLPLTLLHV